MKVFGNVNFQQNYAQNMVIQLDTAYPVNSVPGQIVFKNKTLYICVEIQNGIPIWVPLTKQITAYTHLQSTPATTWTVKHDLNTAAVTVTVYDINNNVIIPNEVTIQNDNTVIVALAGAAIGKVVVLTGYFEGNTSPTYAFEYTQTNPSTSWTVAHGLGRYPIVRVFIGNQEIQPASITFDTIDQLTITFSTPQVGQVKLM